LVQSGRNSSGSGRAGAESAEQAGFYTAVAPRDQPGHNGAVHLAKAVLTAPVLGSRWLFPPRFDAAVAKLLGQPGAGAIPLHQALWHFGSALRMRIDPRILEARLSDFVEDGHGPRWIGSFFLDSGEWDTAVAPLSASPVHREMTELVKAGMNFRDTKAYSRLCRAVAKGRPKLRSGVLLTTRDQVDEYYDYCVHLACSIGDQGVLPRHAVRTRNRPILGGRRQWLHSLEAAERDIGIAIDRNGRLVRHLGGKHRTALAQALGLATIPVEVRLVHVQWLRRHIERSGLPASRAFREALLALPANGDSRSSLGTISER
jgi:hypothetical protein